MQANVRLEHQLLAVEGEHDLHCLLELEAPPAPGAARRLPLHVALVLDRSGSMAGEKLRVARACARYLVRRLRPVDRFALVAYDHEVELRAPLAPVDPGRVEAVIAGIGPGGQTNLSGGWLKGAEVLRGVPAGSGPRKVLLLTDGLANVGITDPEALVALARQAGDDGIGTTTIGFGRDFDEVLLTRMADAGGGNAHHAETPEDAPGIFAAEFEDLVRLVAQNVSVEIRPSEAVRFLGVLNDHPVVAVRGGVQLQLGDAYGEERRRVVFTLHVPRLARLGVAKVADVVVRYVAVGERIAHHELTLPIVVNLVRADEAARAEADAEVTEEVVVLRAARAQEEARERAEAGDLGGARALLSSGAEELKRFAPRSKRADDLRRQAEEMERHASRMEPGAYDPSTAKRMRYESWRRRRGRSQPGGDPSSRPGS
ncbi:MAG TPA: VWA domain-containing protein [Actinomycetota bacterium]|nr:VWA domain-containing protein [Actinomycetota bacterium]